MKILVLLLAIINIALFMWEYKSGKVDIVEDNTEKDVAFSQEKINLVNEQQTLDKVPIAKTDNQKNNTLENADNHLDSQKSSLPVATAVINHVDDIKNNSKIISNQSLINNKDSLADTKTLKIPSIAPLTLPTDNTPNNKLNTKNTIIIGKTTAPNNTETTVDKKTLKTPPLIASIEKEKIKPLIDKAVNISNKSPEKNNESTVLNCYEVSGFNDKSYHEWLAQVANFKKNLRLMSSNKQTPASYLVYYPVNDNANIDLTVQLLKSHNIANYYRLRDGEYRGHLSLGVFKVESNALEFHKGLLSKGIHAQLKPLYKSQAQRYASIKGNNSILEKTLKLKKIYSELSIKTNKNCQ